MIQIYIQLFSNIYQKSDRNKSDVKFVMEQELIYFLLYISCHIILFPDPGTISLPCFSILEIYKSKIEFQIYTFPTVSSFMCFAIYTWCVKISIYI